MSVYELSNYLFVCEDSFWMKVDCGRRLVVEQQKSIAAAAVIAESHKWFVSPPGPFDDDRTWSALCPEHASIREERINARSAAAGLRKPQ